MANVTLKNVTAGPINGLNLAVRDREFAVLASPDASAISAIVRVIAGLEDASTGEIFFDERRANDIAPKDRDVAFVARDYTAYPRMSVFENLAIGLRGRKFAETEIKKRIMAVAAALGLEAQLEQNATQLSHEQQLFVGLARAMVRQPKVYLFDQPFADLEPAAARRGRAQVGKLHQRSSATVVYGTTAPAEALALGQRTVVVLDGVVQQDALAQNIYEAPANLAVAKFFGNPPMNLVTGTLKQDRNGLVFSEAGDGTIAVPLPPDRFPNAKDFLGKQAVLGFRPEAVEIDSSAAAGRFRALVERAEPQGAATDLYLQTGSHALIARSQRWSEQGEGGHRLEFRITMEKAHLFDPETGRRVTLEA